jgi:hypothetical protein
VCTHCRSRPATSSQSTCCSATCPTLSWCVDTGGSGRARVARVHDLHGVSRRRPADTLRPTHTWGVCRLPWCASCRAGRVAAGVQPQVRQHLTRAQVRGDPHARARLPSTTGACMCAGPPHPAHTPGLLHCTCTQHRQVVRGP